MRQSDNLNLAVSTLPYFNSPPCFKTSFFSPSGLSCQFPNSFICSQDTTAFCILCAQPLSLEFFITEVQDDLQQYFYFWWVPLSSQTPFLISYQFQQIRSSVFLYVPSLALHFIFLMMLMQLYIISTDVTKVPSVTSP